MCLLTAQERDVLRLLAESLTSEEIGERLSLRSAEVAAAIASTYAKLDVTTRTDAGSALAPWGCSEQVRRSRWRPTPLAPDSSS
jgi:DNA-binding CsgD family transcriptional regulator